MSEYISEAQRAFDYATYKQPADKIRQNLSKIYNNPASSAKRWVWELVQNAKDIRNKFGKVSIVIELESENKLIFRHNGDPFKINNIIGLIRQVSSKDSLNEDDETTGKFGTGFICTHILSEIIDINGVLDYQGYRKFDLRLDRSGRGSEELIPRIREVETKFVAPEVNFPETPNYEGNRKEEDFDTSFTYSLTSTEKQKAAKNGLDDLINTLPITLVTQSKNIKQVRVIDRVNHSDVVYICESSKLDSDVKLSIVSINDVKKYYLTYETAEVALTTEVECKDGGYVILKRDTRQPVLYRDFPLIGSETFYFPYTLNGFRMNPTEKRNSIPLNGNDNWEAVENRNIIDHAVESALKFNDWLIAHNATNRYLMAYSQKPVAEVAYDEDIALPWINELQKNWREKLLKQNLLECEDGCYYPMEEMLLPECSKKDSRETFWDLLCPFVERRMPKKEHIHEWRSIMAEYPAWNCVIKYTLEDFLNDLASEESLSAIIEKFDGNENAAIEWLNKVIKFTFAELGSDAFDNYSILPNQNGDFVGLSDLWRDNTQRIPTEIKDVYQIAFDEDLKDTLLHTSIDISCLTSIKEYTLSALISDLNNFIKDTNKDWGHRRDASFALTQLYSSEDSKNHRSTMYYLLSSHTTKVSSFSKVDNLPDEVWTEK